MTEYPLECPDCGSDHLEDNGSSPHDPNLTMLCIECGHQWEPNDLEEDEDEDGPTRTQRFNRLVRRAR